MIAAIATVLVVVLGSMAAFALSRYAFPGRDGLFLLFAVGLLFPINAAALPLYLMLDKLGLLDNPLGRGPARSRVRAAAHDRDPAAVHARDPRRAGGRRRGGRGDPDRVLPAHPAAAVPARAGHRGRAGLRPELEPVPDPAARVHQPGTLHAAAAGWRTSRPSTRRTRRAFWRSRPCPCCPRWAASSLPSVIWSAGSPARSRADGVGGSRSPGRIHRGIIRAARTKSTAAAQARQRAIHLVIQC